MKAATRGAAGAPGAATLATGGVELASVAPFRLGALGVRPAAREVSGPLGRTLAEPRALQVLVCLHEAHGEVVSHDALVRRCWAGRAIGEDAIHRAVAKARHLAELSAPPAFTIESIPRVGYRLTVAEAATPATDALLRPHPPPLARRGWVVAAAAGVVAALALLVAAPLWPHAPAAPAAKVPRLPRPTLPADPAAAALFVQAREEWAQRSAESLDRSIAAFTRVTRRAPDFAPAFADLADAYLLAGEAGSLPDTVAFGGAEQAAARALQLDPDLADAHRAEGFGLYWWRHDAPAAGAAFRTALRLDPRSAQTHFWYANVLADAGEAAPAMREFAQARLGDPGSTRIEADYAWALWIQSRDAEALSRLKALVAREPTDAEAQDCLAGVLLAAGDAAGYLRGEAARARLRREPMLQARVRELAAAHARGGARAMLDAAIAQELADQAGSPYPDRSTAAFYASLTGDRGALLHVLDLAEAEHERWGAAGYVRRIRTRWRDDRPVIAALDRRAAPPVEAPSAPSGG